MIFAKAVTTCRFLAGCVYVPCMVLCCGCLALVPGPQTDATDNHMKQSGLTQSVRRRMLRCHKGCRITLSSDAALAGTSTAW